MPQNLTKADLIGNKVSIKEVAAAFGQKSTKPAMALIRRLSIPTVVIDRLPHVDLAEFRAAIDREMTRTAPRGRGRPRVRMFA